MAHKPQEHVYDAKYYDEVIDAGDVGRSKFYSESVAVVDGAPLCPPLSHLVLGGFNHLTLNRPA